MCEKNVTIINEAGIHARPAGNFVKMAKQYQSRIMIRNLTSDSYPVSAKSISLVLTLGLTKGTSMAITADGPDDEEAVDVLASFVEQGCGE